MSIENAAREIAGCYYDGNSNCQKDIAEIIRRHLFPSVKPEEVRPLTWYWVCDEGTPITIRMSDREGKKFSGFEWECIYGPIQMPE